MAGPYSPLPSSAGACVADPVAIAVEMRLGCDCPGVGSSGGNSEAGPSAGTAGIEAAGFFVRRLQARRWA